MVQVADGVYISEEPMMRERKVQAVFTPARDGPGLSSIEDADEKS